MTQVRAALVAADITPIFAVTSNVVPTYQGLASELAIPGTAVIELARNSSNLVDVIYTGLTAICTCGN